MAEGRRHEGASIPGLEIMIYAAIVIVLLVVLWHFAHDPIAWPVLWAAQRSEPLLEVYARLAALTNAAWFVDLVVPRRIYDWTDIAATSQALQALQVQDVDYPTFKKLLAIIGVVMRPALLIAAIGAVYFIYNNTAASRLRRRMTLKTMVPIAARTFPAIKPAFQQDLLAVHPDEGPWARERSPIRTAILNHLIIAHARDAWGTVQWDRPFVPTFDESLDGKAVPGLADVLYRKVDDDLEQGISKLHGTCSLREDEAERLWCQQLGRPWSGMGDLPDYERALLVALLAFGELEKDAALALIDQMADTWRPGALERMSTDGMEALWEKVQDAQGVQQLLSQHAYVTTLLPAALRYARRKGKIASSRFIWLKVENRTLWYALNQEGGQCAWSEALGPRSHLVGEVEAGGALPRPYTAAATTALLEYLRDSEGWIPAPEQDVGDEPAPVRAGPQQIELG